MFATSQRSPSTARFSAPPRARESVHRSPATLTNPAWSRIATGVRVSEPYEPAEREADRAADAVMRGELAAAGAAPGGGAPVQRMCAECEEEQKATVQAQRAESGSAAASGGVTDLAGLDGRGESLPGALRGEFEPRFGRDFGDVRVHADGRAARSARALDANAYTYGRHIVFGAGQFDPGSARGRRLIAHELAHVVQQSPGIARKKLSETEKLENLVSVKYASNERLQQAFDNSPLMKIGECNEAVRLIQEGLVADGFAMPRSTLEDGELDGNFGTETYNTIMNFQSKHKIGRDGIVGRDTLQQLDTLAVANKLPPADHASPVDCRPVARRPQPIAKKPGPVKDCVMHAVYANERSVNFCASSSCGVAVQFDVQRITRTGPKCPPDFAGKTLNERVTIIDAQTSCPHKPQVVTGSAPIQKDGTLVAATDTYGICFPKKSAGELMEFGFTSCDAAMRQELIIDGKVFEVRIISLHVDFQLDLSDPQFLSCSGFGSVS